VNERKLKLSIQLPGGRLDQILSTNVKDISRTRLQKLIREGHVQVDGVVITKPAFQLEGNVIVEVNIPAPKSTQLKAEKIPLDVIFENQDLLVINKPPGMVVHPSVGHASGTLVHAVLAHAPDIQGIGGERRPGVVHRLDKDTSGIILMAKNDLAHQMLQEQFRQRKVEKTYLALVHNKPPTPTGRIEAAIGRDPQHRQKMTVVPNSKGREAISIYKTIENFESHAFLEIRPFTGRTHQIRVHLAFIGCPVVGDKVYGGRKTGLDVKRQFLHAEKLKIQLPGEEGEVVFHAPLPSDLNQVLVELRGNLQAIGGKEG
jgi:23S rRNA pseudouridine1911/1915/1917 synthase